MSARDWARAIAAVQRMADEPGTTLPGLVLSRASQRGDAPALIGRHDRLSHAGLAAQAQRIARWAAARRWPPGTPVALLMPNCPDYVALWLGLTAAGHPVALLNTNLSAEALAQCVASAGAGQGIVAASLAPLVAAIPIPWWQHGQGPSGLPRITDEAAACADGPLDPSAFPPPAPTDRALLIYTSGTTGPPKAAQLSHARILEWSAWFAALIDARPEDRLYDCLPLYHSTGGVVAIGCMLLAGGSVVIRERFSASRFWDDVIATDCTIVQYIGELCRYLLRAPPPAAPHRIRLFCGNGLRGDVWQPLQARCAIPRILEFYAATEGSVSLYNVEGRPGTIGRVPPYLAHRFGVALIRCDPETQTPLRDAAGRCIACAPDEPGEAIGPVSAAHPFDGYTDPAATARKLLTDVFRPGDRWFRTGDLMTRDAAGYFRFIDRLGDGFRWKGENVAASDVEAVIARCPGILDAVVYGVEIPGQEGRAGMAAIVVDSSFAMPGLQALLEEHLPAYARPLFIRICPDIERTGTFKLQKTRLRREGITQTGSDLLWRAEA